MSWRLLLWCSDCSVGQDPQGCFDGGESRSDEVFATKAEAERFAVTITAPWECEVVEGDAPVTASCDPSDHNPKLTITPTCPRRCALWGVLSCTAEGCKSPEAATPQGER